MSRASLHAQFQARALTMLPALRSDASDVRGARSRSRLGQHPQLRIFGAPSTASSPCYSSSVETSIAKGAAPKTKRAANGCRRRRRAHGLACGWCGLGCRAARGSVHSCLGASGAHLEQPQHATRAPRPCAPSAHRGATCALHGKKMACSRTRGGSSCCAHKL